MSETEIEEKKDNKDRKKKKPKGPIRTGAVVPFIVISGLVIGFNILFLDSTLRSAIEFIGSKVNSAEVNVASVQTNFKDLQLKIKGIQLTNRNKPDHNLLQLGEVEVSLLWDGILRGKLVINNAEVKDILVDNKRKSPGKIYESALDEESESNKKAKEMLKKAEKEFDGNVFGDIAGVLAGGSTGDVSKNIEGTLESKKRFEELKVEIEQKKASLSNDFKKLPDQKKLKSLQTRLKKIRWKDLGNLAKAPKVLKEADDLKKDIDKAVKSIEKANKNLNKSLKEINSSYKEAESLVQKDINSVKKRMNLPSLDTASIAKMLFGKEILDKVSMAKEYQAKAQKYMPPKKEKKKKVKPPRGEGKNYRFGNPKSYPLFWLKHAKINSKNDQGDITGQLTNVTNNQSLVGKLTNLKVKANFPPKEIMGVDFSVDIDHRDAPKAMIVGEIASLGVRDKALSDTPDATFVIAKSSVHSKYKGTVTPEKIDLRINNLFKDIDFKTSSKTEAVDIVLKDVAKKNTTLSLDAKVTGKWDALGFDIKSNLAEAIQSSVQSVIREKITEAQNKIRADIERQIASTRADVDKQINDVKSKYQKELDKGKKEMAKAKSQLDKQKKKAEKDAKKNLKNPFKNIKL